MRLPVWLWVYYVVTSYVGTVWLIRVALRPLHRWREKVLAAYPSVVDHSGRNETHTQ